MSVLWVFHGCFKDASQNLQGYFRSALIVFQASPKVVSGKRFKGVKVNFNVFKGSFILHGTRHSYSSRWRTCFFKPPPNDVAFHKKYGPPFKGALNMMNQLMASKIPINQFFKHSVFWEISAGLCVIVSWISFLLPIDMVPGRMTLLATLFLVLVTIFNSVATITPKVKGLTAIEAWMLACILFLFGAFIE